uniref:Uncharacterized protein n=1 Tax=Ciona savignyi TaxID=51511 RepID=H2YJ30_CIOSA
SNFSIEVVLTCFCLFLLLVYNVRVRHGGTSGTLPGKDGFPIVGCFPMLGKHKEKVLMKWSTSSLGPMFYIRLGTSKVLVLNGYDAIKEALEQKPLAIAGRVESKFLDNGLIWKEQRKFGQTTLGGLGMGKQSFQSKIRDEFNCLAATLESELSINGPKGVNFTSMLRLYAANIISSLVFNQTFDSTCRYVVFLNRFIENIRLTPCDWQVKGFKPSCSDYMTKPFKMTSSASLAQSIFQALVDKHRKSRDPNDPRDFVDCYLNVMEKKQGKNSSFTEKQLLYYIVDLFLAGTETSANTNAWAILLVLKNPQVKAKLRSELEAFGKSPTLEDEAKMPYTRAVMQEVFRYRTSAPLNIVARRTTSDLELKGYKVPANMPVIANLWSVHHDPLTWAPYPETFRPERHLDGDGNFIPNDHVMPFSVGARSCIGKNLAKNEVFIFITSIFSQFDLELADGCHVDNMDGDSGMLLHPPEYRVKGSIRV